MRNGTQEELDAAREDARLIPENALFNISKEGTAWDVVSLKACGYSIGDTVVRVDGIRCDEGSVSFKKNDSEMIMYFTPTCLEPIK